jgi:hypothetical protein
MNQEALNKQDYLDLWKFFSEDTAKIKDKLWTIASWLYALMSGLMAYMLDAEAGELRPVIGVVGIILSIYTCYMICQYGIHIRNGWNATNYLKTKIGGMEEIWHNSYDNESCITYIFGKRAEKIRKHFCSSSENASSGDTGLPAFARRLMHLAAGYGLIFGALEVYFFIKSFS